MPSAAVLKLIGWALAAAMLSGGLLWAYRAVENHFIGVDNLRTQLFNVTQRANEEELARKLLEETNKINAAHDAYNEKNRIKHQDEIDSIYKKNQKDMKVLEDRDRFSRVTIAKPGLVQKLSNAATEKVFEDLENTFNQ